MQVDQGGYLAPLRLLVGETKSEHWVLTLDELLRRTPLAQRLSKMLRLLEDTYHSPVDTEFTVRLANPTAAFPDTIVTLLQCRPQSQLTEVEARLPQHIREEDIIFSTRRMAPQGRVNDIEYVLFVPPEEYFALSTPRLALNSGDHWPGKQCSERQRFICVGPGRWGTTNPDLGVSIGYGDIYHTRALVELAGQGIGHAPEASFGTHFFQDLVEIKYFSSGDLL